MESKKTEKIKSKTPVRSVISHLIEESSSQEDYSEENNSNEKYNEPTDYSPEPKPYTDDWTHEQESIMYLKYEIQTKQKLIEDLTETRENLKHTLNKFKAQNKELNFQLKDYKEKNFELEKEIFLMREKLIIREKEAQRLFIENESLKRQQAIAKKDRELSAKPRNKLDTEFSVETFNFTERVEDTSKSIVKDLLRVLKVESQAKVLPTVLNLKDSLKKSKKYEVFFKKISVMVFDFSPVGYFKSDPTLKEVWTWIVRLLEEYMRIKKSLKQ